jgi:hypothetical protein
MSVVASMSTNLVATATTITTSMVTAIQDTSTKLFPQSHQVFRFVIKVEMTGCFLSNGNSDVDSFFLPGYEDHGILLIEDFIN